MGIDLPNLLGVLRDKVFIDVDVLIEDVESVFLLGRVIFGD